MFEVRLTKTAEEDLQKISLKTQASILEKIKILESTPFPTIKPVKKIKAPKRYHYFASELVIIELSIILRSQQYSS